MPHVHQTGSEWMSASLIVILVLAMFVYARGWLRLRSSPNALPAWRAGSFVVGLLSIWTAIGSRLGSLDHEWLTAHMIQHLLLMTIAPPLVWIGAPFTCCPRVWRPRAWPIVQRIGRVCTHPAFCWLAATAVLVGWHVPAAFALGMQSTAWHGVEQASFLATGLLFWWPVVQPGPATPTGPQWWIVLYLFLATLPCDVLSAFLIFSDRVAYPIYLTGPQRSGLSVLADQQCAGALMWTAVTIVYLVAGTIVTARMLSGRSEDGRGRWELADTAVRP